jgi:uncharacterized membrane protein
MNKAQLDNRRHEMMEALYAASGRTCSTYTGLWEEFCRDIAANFRDTDYAELHAACVVAIGETESILADKHAQQAIAICRRQLLGKWA